MKGTLPGRKMENKMYTKRDVLSSPEHSISDTANYKPDVFSFKLFIYPAYSSCCE